MKNNVKFKQTEIGEIPENWEIKQLGDYLDLVTYGFTCPMPTTTTGPFMVTAKDITGGKIQLNTCRRTSQEAFDAKLTDKSRPKIGDILLTKDGTLGRLAVVDKDNICINQSVALLRPKQTIDSVLLKYLLEAPYYQKKMEEDSDGTTIKHIYITRVNKMKISLPISKSEQKNIVKILKSLDDKIELNQKTIKTLEEIGQSLFKRWFVDFEFPNEKGEPYKSSGGEMIDSELGEIPKRWSVSNLDSIGTFLNGLALQKYPKNGEDFLYAIKIKELNNGITESTDKVNVDIPKKYIVDYGDLLFSWSGSLDIVIWGEGKGALNQHLFKVTSDLYPKWFIYSWIKKYISFFQMIAVSKATTMGHIQRKHLTEALVSIPPKDVLDKANESLQPILNSLIEKKKEIQTLVKIKNYLLPKLLSGKIRIN